MDALKGMKRAQVVELAMMGLITRIPQDQVLEFAASSGQLVRILHYAEGWDPGPVVRQDALATEIGIRQQVSRLYDALANLSVACENYVRDELVEDEE